MSIQINSNPHAFKNSWNIVRVIHLDKKQHKLLPWDVRLIFTIANMKGDNLDFLFHLPDVRKHLPQIISDLTILFDTKEWVEMKIGEVRGMRVIEGIRQRTDQEQLESDAAKERLIIQ